MYRRVVTHGWPAAAGSDSGSSSGANLAGSSSSSSSVKLRGLAGRGEDGWRDCLDARNANSTTAFQTAMHFCKPEVVRFFLQDRCFSLEMLTEPTRYGGELFVLQLIANRVVWLLQQLLVFGCTYIQTFTHCMQKPGNVDTAGTYAWPSCVVLLHKGMWPVPPIPACTCKVHSLNKGLQQLSFLKTSVTTGL
jgi:hypothetical protein